MGWAWSVHIFTREAHTCNSKDKLVWTSLDSLQRFREMSRRQTKPKNKANPGGAFQTHRSKKIDEETVDNLFDFDDSQAVSSTVEALHMKYMVRACCNTLYNMEVYLALGLGLGPMTIWA